MSLPNRAKERALLFERRAGLFNEIEHAQIQAAQLAETAFKNRVAPLFETISSFEQDVSNLAGPFAEGGASAFQSFLNTLGVAAPGQNISSEEASQLGLSQFQSSAQRQFLEEQLDIDRQAFTRQASAQGLLGSGNFAASLQELGQTRANQAFGQFQQGLLSGAELGQRSVGQEIGARQFGLQQRLGLTQNIANVESQSKLAQGLATAQAAQGLLGEIRGIQQLNASPGFQADVAGRAGLIG